MDIDLLSKMVYDLILENDKVALPGVGCFVAEIVPATFSDKGYTINPPYRKLYFRSHPDDGSLLVDLYAKSNGVSQEAARGIITDFLSEMKEILLNKKVIVFPGLGRLRATKENNLFFVADESLDIFPEGLGLEPLSLKTHRETPEDLSAAMTELGGIMSSPAEAPAETPAPEPAPAPATEPAPEPTLQPDPAPTPEPAATPAPQQHSAASSRSRAMRATLIAVLSLICLALIALIAFVLISRTNPELLDPLLYSAEELQILNAKI